MKKSWTYKLLSKKDLPKIVDLPVKLARKYGEGTMYIPSPLEIHSIVKQIRENELVTTSWIRNFLSSLHNTTITCPLTTGIFINIVANASEEDKKYSVPYWRVLKSNGELNNKYPGGVESHKTLLEKDGYMVYVKGKTYRVKEYELFYPDIKAFMKRFK